VRPAAARSGAAGVVAWSASPSSSCACRTCSGAPCACCAPAGCPGPHRGPGAGVLQGAVVTLRIQETCSMVLDSGSRCSARLPRERADACDDARAAVATAAGAGGSASAAALPREVAAAAAGTPAPKAEATPVPAALAAASCGVPAASG
jgi:hypothetical protein